MRLAEPTPLGFAVFGAGRIGALHARHLAGAVDGARLVRVVDPDAAAARRSALGGAIAGDDVAEALSDPAVDAVVIASPTVHHAEQLEAAAAAGKAIFCEKPVADDLAGTVRAMAVVARTEVPFQIGFNRRFDPAYAEVGRAVRAGELGPVELFRSQSSDPGPAPEAYIAASAGFFHDSVIHDIDTARFVCGEVERVTALGRVRVDPLYAKYGDVDTSVLTLEFTSGALGVLMNSRRTVYGHDLRLEVHGALGKLVAEDERATKVWRYGPGGPRGDYYHHFLDRFRDAYRLEVQAFVDAVRAGRTAEPGASDAVESLRVAEAARLSLREGRPVGVAEVADAVEVGGVTPAVGATIRVANAPCSWGTIEGFGEATPWNAMLDQLAGAGYAATELGDLGYLPDDPVALRAALDARGLALLGGFEGVDLRAPDAVERHRERLLAVAKLLAAAGDGADGGDPGRAGAAGRRPYFILADATCGDPERTRLAGRVPRNLRLDAGTQATFARNAAAIARLVAEECGLRTLFHHHCGAWVETPDEIARFLDAVPAGLVDLVFDTGHFTYGTGRPDAHPTDPPGRGTAALDGLRRFWGRVPYVHLKDCHAGVAARARVEGLGYPEAVGAGVFCELGEGSVDLAGVVDFLRAHGYADWVTVEQDVLPGMGTPEASARRNRDVLRGLGL